MPNKTRTYYQPFIRWEKEEWILPEELASFHAFASKSDAEQFVAEMGYSNYELKIEEYHNDDIEEVTILDGYGNIVEINEDDPDDPLVCAVCGSSKILLKAWVNPNTHKFVEPVEPVEDYETNHYCKHCNENTPFCHRSEFEQTTKEMEKEFLGNNNKLPKPFFIYQSHSDGRETLYKSGLSYEQADEAFNTLEHLIESGSVGDGCAVQGSLDREDDFYVAQRLGLIDKSFSSFDDYMETIDNIASDLCLRDEHESMFGPQND